MKINPGYIWWSVLWGAAFYLIWGTFKAAIIGWFVATAISFLIEIVYMILDRYLTNTLRHGDLEK